MKLIKYRPGDRILLAIADIIVRVAFFFFGGTLALFSLSVGGHRYNYSGPYFVEIALLAGVLSAIFGPSIYQRSVMRGRGSLEEVKRQSGDDGE